MYICVCMYDRKKNAIKAKKSNSCYVVVGLEEW